VIGELPVRAAKEYARGAGTTAQQKEKNVVSTYIILGNYTEQGIRNLKGLAQLRQAAERWVASKGGKVISNYTTFGPYDFVFTCELPNDEACLEGVFLFGSQGSVRTQTLKAFPYADAERIAESIG